MSTRILIAATVICAVFFGAAVAVAEETSAEKKAPASETAAFAITNLADAKIVKALAKALSDKPGIISSGADKEKKLFTVTFEPGKTNAQEILKTLTAVAKDAKLEGAAAATEKPAGHDCGKCPKVKTCDKKK